MPKLDQIDQGRVTAYLQSLNTIYGVSIILRVCCQCQEMLGPIDGQGVHGISHVLRCPKCKEEKKHE